MAALLDTVWRVADAEHGRRENIERKAGSVATFSSVIVSLTAALGIGVADVGGGGQLALYVVALSAFLSSIGMALWVLLPRAYRTFSIAYLEGLTEWPELLKAPEQVQGETMAGLVEITAATRLINYRNARRVFYALLLLIAGLLLLAVEAAVTAASRI